MNKMEQFKKFEAAVNTLFWSWGSTPPVEVVWGMNEMIDWIEWEFDVNIIGRFHEDVSNFEEVMKEIKEKVK